MEYDELAEHLDALKRDDCYRVDSTLKESGHEVTQKVYFVGANGAEQGPYIRKYIEQESGLGSAYGSIHAAEKAGKRFSHLPHIIDYYSMGDKTAVIMECVPGETLQEAIYRCDPSEALANDLFPKICDAVIEMHEGFAKPLIHRDLKPSNIMLTKDHLWIIDFGIARQYSDESDEDTARFGTRSYAPPEQFGFGQTDERSDVYALGALLYYCLTEKNLNVKTLKEGFGEKGIPGYIRAVLAKATAFDPDDRYQSVAELKNDFLTAITASPYASVLQSPTPTVPMGQTPVFSALASGPGVPPRGAMAPVAISSGQTTGNKLAVLMGRIPFGVGVAWDILLAITFVLFVIVTVQMTIAPTPNTQAADWPAALRALQYFSVSLLMFGSLFYLVCDRRPLRRMFPNHRWRKLSTEALICALVFVAGVLVIAITGQFI